MYVRTRSSRPVLVALLAVLGLLAAACANDEQARTGDAAGETPAAAPGDGAADAEDGIDRSDWPQKIVLAAVPAEQEAQLRESYRVTREILEDQLGIKVEFFQAADYAGVIEALIAERVDLAQFGPFSYVIARANGADADPVGVMVDEAGGEPGYESFLVTRAGNEDIAGIEDVAGRRVCFVDPASTSGYLYPAAGLIEAGIDPEADITPVFAGGHDASVIAVVAGDCDAGFAFDTMVTQLLPERGEIQEGDVEVVWRSPVIPGSPMAMRNALPESLKEEIRRIFEENINVDWAFENGFCESNDPAECSFSDEAIWGYVPRDDSFYDGVRKLCQQLGTEVAPQCEGI